MTKFTRTRGKHAALVAGAAGMLLSVPLNPLATSVGSAYAADPVSRHPQQMLQNIADRETQALGLDETRSSDIVTVAGETPAATSGASAGGVDSNAYNSEVQRQLQLLYQQDGRQMPQMVVPPVSAEAIQNRRNSPRRSTVRDMLNPTEWTRRFRRNSNHTPPPPPPPVFGNAEPAPFLMPTSPPPAYPTSQVNPTTQGHPPTQAYPTTRATPPLQRVSPEIFNDAAPRTPIAAPEQPRFFPGAAESPTPRGISSADSSPLLIILPDPTAGGDTFREPQSAPPALVEEPQPTANPFAEATALPSRPVVLQAPVESSENPFAAGEPVGFADEGPFFGKQQAEPLAAEPALAEAPAPNAAANEVETEETGPFTGLQLEAEPYTEPLPARDISAQPALPAPTRSGPRMLPESTPASLAGKAPATLPAIAPQRPLQAAQLTAPPAPPAVDEAAESKMARIASRQGLTGFKGFCPVTLRDRRELIDAKTEFTAIYQGQQFWFASAEAKQAFLLNPGAYAPAGGGIDAVVYQQTGRREAGSLDYAVWYRGRLYLFTSDVSKVQFVAAPRTHAFTE